MKLQYMPISVYVYFWKILLRNLPRFWRGRYRAGRETRGPLAAAWWATGQIVGIVTFRARLWRPVFTRVRWSYVLQFTATSEDGEELRTYDILGIFPSLETAQRFFAERTTESRSAGFPGHTWHIWRRGWDGMAVCTDDVEWVWDYESHSWKLGSRLRATGNGLETRKMWAPLIDGWPPNDVECAS